MTKLQDIVLRDTRANQPAAGTAGRLYYVTDESVLERDSGSAWQSVEGAGGLADHGIVSYLDFTNASAPSTPASGKTRIYTKTDKAFYQKDDAGVETALGGGGGGGGAPTTAKYLTTASDGTLSAEVVLPGLAAHADISGSGGAGTSREFESGDTAPTWSPSSPTTDVGTTIASHLYATWADATERFGLYSWAPGSGAFDARAKILVGENDATNGGAIGLIVTDSGNTNRVLVNFGLGASQNWSLVCYTYTASSYTQRGSTWILHSDTLYVRITRDGSNNVSFWISSTGILWQLIATQSFSFTVANIGVRLSAGGSSTHYAAVDWLRTSV